MDTDSTVLGSHFIREVQDGVKCAGFLRRIYEEVGMGFYYCMPSRTKLNIVYAYDQNVFLDFG